ncbi:MAG: DNA recombination protein RmuC [Ancrocorticia sp.]|uniref:DNA recombination protein RmuC n=1 Tax=Ancrocorticia sp. TaxID=2593684 RepID=UPI003F8DAD26
MDISAPLLVILLVAALALGCGLGYFFAQARAARAPGQEAHELAALQASAAAATARAGRLEEENNALIDRAKSDQDIMRALAPLAQQLDTMNRRVQGMQETQTAQSSQLHEQLNSAAVTQRELATETHSLRTALTSNSARGTWGEVELRRIVEAAGMLPHVDFSTQQKTSLVSTAGSDSRPDLTVHLPGGFHLAVDAKVPLSALLKAQDMTGEDQASRAARDKLLAEHAKAVRSHINELSKRNYPAEYPGSPNLTVMFMPAESLLSEALKADPSLLEDALGAGIAPTAPSSLLALLRSVATVWSSAKVTEEAQAIMGLGRTLVDRLNTVAGHLDSLGSALQRSVTAYNKTVGSIETRLLVTARAFESVDTSVAQPREIPSEKGQVRSFTAGELTIEGDSIGGA